jgi:REP element-mobilizing transposase RayT
MANSYSQIHLQLIFAVRFRAGVIHPSWEKELYRYISGIIEGNLHKLLAINGVPDHLHILIGMRPSQSLSELMQDIKTSSSKWINKKGFVPGRFEWQSGYAAFSYDRTAIRNVVRYIENQKEHHGVKTFKDEYIGFLEEHNIDYDERYIFKDLE